MKKITILQVALAYISLICPVIVHTQPYQYQPWHNDSNSQYNNSWSHPCNNHWEDQYNNRSNNGGPLFPAMFGTITGLPLLLCAYMIHEQIVQDRAEEEEKTQPLLNFDQRLSLLQNKLGNLGNANLNIPAIAALTIDYSEQKLERFITNIQNTSYYDSDLISQFNTIFYAHNPIITMHHVQKAFDEIEGGRVTANLYTQKELYNNAVHEAGHAVATMANKQFRLYHVSIVSRKKNDGRNIFSYLESTDLDICKHRLIISLAGGVAEQIFNFSNQWYASHEKKCYDKNINWDALAKNKYICKGLADMCLWQSTSHNMQDAYAQACAIIERQLCKNNPEFTNHVCKLLQECYQACYALLHAQRYEIKMIANLLIKKKIISGDELYTLLHIP